MAIRYVVLPELYSCTDRHEELILVRREKNGGLKMQRNILINVHSYARDCAVAYLGIEGVSRRSVWEDTGTKTATHR